jgi:hypothetical protein
VGKELEKRPDDELRELGEQLDRARVEAETLASDEIAETGTALVHVGRTGAVVKRDMARRKQLIERKRQEIEGIGKRMKELMERKMAEVAEIIDPLRAMIKQLEEGIWTVNLYLGRDERIVTLRKGDAAPADTPIHIRQLVLSMDEETAVHSEDGGLDFEDVEVFDRWLLESEEHIDQLIPDTKGIVAIRPRAEDSRDYGSLSANIAAQEADKHTYFLIRNGGALYRIWTDYSVGDNMVPTADEFTNLFRKRKWRGFGEDEEFEQLEPGSWEYEEAEEQAETRQRHYMRMGLVLQGLVDRTAIFHPLPEAGVNFLSAESHSEGTVRFIMDAEQTVGTGREPFRAWLLRINSELRPGMRIVGAFTGEPWRDANSYHGDGAFRYGHSRLRPGTASPPESYIPLTLDGRKEEYLTVKFKREDKRWDRWEGQVEYKTRASILVQAEDSFIIAIDFAEVEVMEEYLRARTERHDYLTLFPLLKAAIAVKRAEAEAEAPFLKLIAAQLVTENGVSYEDAVRVVPGLVQWWKFKNREHRPLTGKDEDRKALTEIVAEHSKRAKLDKTATPPELLRKLQTAHPYALLIARRPDGYHVVLRPEDDGDVFVAIGVYTKKGKVSEQKRWKLPPRNVLSWRVFYESPRWKRWRRGASLSEYLTGPEKEALAKELIKDDTVAVTYDTRDRQFEAWGLDDDLTVPRKPHVRHDYVRRAWPCQDFDWYRDKGVAKIRQSRDWGSSHRYSGKCPWEPSARAQYGERRIILYVDNALVAKQEARYEKAEAIEAEGRKLKAQFERIDFRIDEQWREMADRKRYEEFIAEYADPDLWEGHKKTLPKLELPEDLTVEFLIPFIEAGEAIDGLTLGELAGRAEVEIPADYAAFVVDGSEWDDGEDEEDEDDDF